VITAGLCRWFHNKGWRVAPFKAQNMSLNSFVTEDGGEMGRAQVYQAEACGLKPHVAMNPILLKPCGDNLSQVIVMGKVAATRNARDYYSHRPTYLQEVQQAFESLRDQYELVILEGAGSPAEINLRQQDYVNMPMAEMADAPVLLVGDIDRGGVFAWLKGTFDLLTPEERERVQGFIINKFRGDLELLKPGLVQLEEMTGKPVLGVIPFDRELYVDEEDALPSYSRGHSAPGPDALDVAVIRLPRISNFTDFASLALDPSVSLRYVWHPGQLGQPDLILLPGTKNTMDDLEFIYEQKLHEALNTCRSRGSIVMGVCGGFQMLGQKINNPDQVESQLSEINGLGWFDFETQLMPEKITHQTQRHTITSPIFGPGLEVTGYEIHMGITRYPTDYPTLFQGEDSENPDNLGLCNREGTVLGTYLHGFFDNDDLRTAFLNHVRRQRGLPEKTEPFDYSDFRQQQLNRLGNLIGRSLDMDRIMGEILSFSSNRSANER
jgi:adenosylcobyric acid synthase